MAVTYEDTKLHEAVRFSDIDLLHHAIREGVNPNAIGLYEWTALHEAAMGGDVTITTLLLENGADSSARDLVNGSTPMHLAASEGNLSVLRLLIENGGNMDLTDDDGKTVFDVTDDVMCKKFLKQKRDSGLCHEGGGHTRARKHGFERGMSQLGVGSVVKVGYRCDVDVPEVLLSVEYNSKSASLKIRVRKLRRMKRPDGDLSAATSLYVKSYLVSSAGKHEAKQKTEDITLAPPEDTPTDPEASSSLLPDLDFSTPLEYTEIHSNKLSDHFVIIAVCCYCGWPITSSSTLASMSLPLQTAVKTIMPTWFGLQPCVITHQPKSQRQTRKISEAEVQKPRKPLSAWVGQNNVVAVRDKNTEGKERKQSGFSWKGVKSAWQSVSGMGNGSQVKVFAVERQPFEVIVNESDECLIEKEGRNESRQVDAPRPIESFRINRSIPDPFTIPSPEKPSESERRMDELEKPPMLKTRESAQLIDVPDDDPSSFPLVDTMEEEIKHSKTVRFKSSDVSTGSKPAATPIPIILPAISNLTRSTHPRLLPHSSDGMGGLKSDPFVPYPPVKTRESATLIEMDIMDDEQVTEHLRKGIDKKTEQRGRNEYQSHRPRVKEGWT